MRKMKGEKSSAVGWGKGVGLGEGQTHPAVFQENGKQLVSGRTRCEPQLSDLVTERPVLPGPAAPG